MLGKVDLSQKIKKKKYKKRLSVLQPRLQALQKAARQAELPVIVLVESWAAGGKGACLRALTQPLDPRGFKLYTIREARAFEKRKPWLWRFWQRSPARGELVIFDRSWYARVVGEYIDGLISEGERRRALQDILDFERTLADDGALISKFFLHISPEEQKKRFKKRLQNPDTSWRVEPEDWEQNAKYAVYSEALEIALEHTNQSWAPWTVLAANNRRHAQVTMLATLVAALESRLGDLGALSAGSTGAEEVEFPAAVPDSTAEMAAQPPVKKPARRAPRSTGTGRRNSKTAHGSARKVPEPETTGEADGDPQAGA